MIQPRRIQVYTHLTELPICMLFPPCKSAGKKDVKYSKPAQKFTNKISISFALHAYPSVWRLDAVATLVSVRKQQNMAQSFLHSPTDVAELSQ